MIRQCLLIVFILMMCVSGNAQQNFAAVDNWLHHNLHEIGGRGVIMVYKDGKVVYAKAENGLTPKEKLVIKFLAKKKEKDQEQEMQDFTISTVMPIASCSKWLSAAVVMTFVQEGKLKLEDSIGKYLPIMTQNGKGSITVKDCLSHLTGIKAPPIKQAIANQQEFNTMDEALANIAAMPKEGEHGKVFHYSNVGLQMLASVLEKISGKPFETLFKSRIAQPCAMMNTTFGNKAVVSPAGGAMSSAEDYLKFLSMILHDGLYKGKQILTKQSIAMMQQNQAKGATLGYSPEEAGNWGYGFGEWTMQEGATPLDAVCSPGLFGTFPWIDTNKKYAAILFTYNINFKGRHERYLALKALVDEAVENNKN